jgi:hypothetical protein
MKQLRTRQSPNADKVKVHTTSVTPAELEWFTTFNLPFGGPRWMEISSTKSKRKMQDEYNLQSN